jgi:hypothetical protein
VTAERGDSWFRVSAAGALAVHAVLLLRMDGLHGGADLLPHLRLFRAMAEDPGIASVYAPAYHVLGAWLGGWIGAAAFTRVFAFAAAAALIFGFRSFQRAANLPAEASVVFAWSPYLFALTWCVPKVEAAGYALAFFALGRMIERRYRLVGLALACAFFVHTAAALFLGLCGGILALARREWRGLAALAVGTAIAAPLFVAHLVAGCSVAETFLFSAGDYLRRIRPIASAQPALRIAILAGPIAVGAAALGARELWRRHRAVAILCAAVVLLYANELWLAPFGIGTTLNLLRGLTVLAFATAIAAGVALAARPRVAPWVLAACIAWGGVAAFQFVPDSCFVQSLDEAVVGRTSVDRCRFKWHKNRAIEPGSVREERPAPVSAP